MTSEEEEEQRQNWRKYWLSSLAELTNLSEQKDKWYDFNEPSPHYSYSEYICCYFDDLVIDDNYKLQLNNGYISQVEWDIIGEWHKQLSNYQEPIPQSRSISLDVLNDPEWLRIIDLGVKAKNELLQIISKNEQDILNGIV